MSRDPAQLAARLLAVIEDDIVPLTRAGMARGDKLFGAAVLAKADLSLVVAATNEESRGPLWHGEVVAIRDFHALPHAARPRPRDCLFLATHEPCSLCLSAITWAGFDNFYYLFSYEDSRDAFGIPHDLEILAEVFDCPEGAYRAENAYWRSRAIPELVAAAAPPACAELDRRAERLRRLYGELSAAYQAGKGAAGIPLA